MKKLIFVFSALSILGTVIPADAQTCPPGKRYYCQGIEVQLRLRHIGREAV